MELNSSTSRSDLSLESHFRSLIDHMLDGFAYCKMHYADGIPDDFTYLDVNPAFERLTGLSNVIGKNVSEVIPGIKASNPELLEIYGRVALSGKTEKFETYLPGLQSWFSISVYSPARDYFIATFDNITDRKNVEINLRDSEARLRLSQESGGIGIWEADLVNNSQYWSKECIKILGFPALAQPSYEDFLAAILPEDRPLVIDAHHAHLEHGEKYDISYRILAKGKLRWMRSIGSAVRDESGKPILMRGVVQDITEMKQTTQELISTKELLNETEQIGKVGGWQFYIDTLSLTWTKGVYDIHEVGLDFELTVQSAINFYTSPSKPIIEQAVRRAIDFGESYDIELEIVTAKGNLRNVHTIGIADAERRRVYGFFQDITVRKNAEKALQKSEDRLKAILDATPFPIAIVDLQDNNINFWSRSAITLFGHTAPTAAEWYEIAYPDVAYRNDVVNRWKPFLEEAQSSGQSINTGEYQVTCRDGSVRICELYAAFLPDNLVVTFNDVTVRKQAEEVLLQSKLIIDATQDGFFTIDTDGFLTGVNQSYVLMSGYSTDELVGMHMSRLSLVNNTTEKVQSVLKLVIKQGHLTFESQHRRKDGSFIEVEASISYLESGNYFYAFHRDITKRKQQEAELRLAAASFDTHDAILITDANGDIIRVNQAFQNITGYGSEEVLGKNPRILKSGLHDKEFYRQLWERLLEKGSWTGEIWDKRKNGEIYPKWITISAVKNVEGKTTEYVAIFTDITERKKAEEEIHSLAYYDILTSLPNRRFLLDKLRQAQSISARSRNFGALLFLDMDRFKILNDTLGHDFGDLFLIEIAKRLQSCVRDADTVARVGGDEFVVLIEEIDVNPEEASQKVSVIAEKIRATLGKPYQLKEHEKHSSPSIGVCLYRGNDSAIEAILKQADMAMYQAKESGGNSIRYFDPDMQSAVETRAAIEADLRQAIPEKHLRLYYQIQLDSGSVPIGAEALIRWIHPERGLVPPIQFIPVAEESSLILDIGQWVLETACNQLYLWSKSDLTRNLVLAVNVSAQQFKRHNFVESITALINIYDINPNLLKLELTESVVLSDVTDVISKMHLLKKMGVRLSLDDFGTGYSSLSYLKQLPLDQIKIDQSFVRDMTVDPNDAVMVQTIINLANNFKMNVIAEGVETEDQLKFLRDNGCLAYQGYLFSKPVPIEEFESLLTRYGKG